MEGVITRIQKEVSVPSVLYYEEMADCEKEYPIPNDEVWNLSADTNPG